MVKSNRPGIFLTCILMLLVALPLLPLLSTPASAIENPVIIINTVAGSEPTDPTLATLNLQGGITLDASGNLYIADYENHRVQMVNTSGVISIVAGNGNAGYSGDGGPATSAELYFPDDVAVDLNGNLYIADTFNNVIRMVNTSGIINTIAGTGAFGGFDGDGVATSKLLLQPKGVLVDPSGNIYIADTGNSIVRIVNSLGLMNTIAGIGGVVGYSGDGGPATNALLNSPRGLAINSTGALYISDYDNESVRIINSSGIINTIAGTGVFGYSGDGGPATSALLNAPMGIDFDASDNLYIADSSNSAIRNVINITGDINTVAGTGSYGYSGDGGFATSAVLNAPYGVAVNNSTGDLYISDTLNSRIRRVDSSGTITHFAGNGFEGSLGDGGQADATVLYDPNGVASDSSGNLYIVDLVGHQVRKVDASGIITTIAGTGNAGYSGDGALATSAMLNTPAALALDESTNTLYIADSNNHSVRAVDLTLDTISTVTGDGTPDYYGDGGSPSLAQLYLPRGLALDSAGNLFIADTFNDVIRKIDFAQNEITTFAGDGFFGYSGDGGLATSGRLTAPYGVWVDTGSNTLYIADTYNHVIRYVDLATNIINTVAGDKVSGTGGYSGDGGPATSALLNTPEAVTVSVYGEIFIADTQNHAIRYISLSDGIINTLVGTGSPGFSNTEFFLPGGIIAALANTIYIADNGNKRVRSMELTNRYPSAPVLLTPSDNSTGLANTVEFAWEAAIDFDGDTVAHGFYICNTSNFSGCSPVTVSSKINNGTMYASSIPLIFFAGIFVLAGAGITRQRLMAALLILAMALFVLSCGSSGSGGDGNGGDGNGGGNGDGDGDPVVIITHTVTGLDPLTTYYWKVSADDSRGGITESDTWSFTTQ